MPSISDSDYCSRGKIDTIYSTKGHYWGYHVANKNADNSSARPYTVPAGYDLTEEDIAYKCQRDVGYIVGGFKNDI